MADATHIKDHYKTLEIQASASLQDIKKAYRRLALQYHPDKNPDNPYAAGHFREIQEAYQVLSSETKRRVYDEERWLAGMGNRARDKEVVTPGWLYTESLKLSKHMTTVDTYRMSHSSLYDYILLLLSDAHMAVLLQHGDTETNHKIIHELVKATKGLKYLYMDEVAHKLAQLAGNDNDILQVIYRHLMERKRASAKDKYLPLFVIIATLIICMMMYFYSKR